MKKTSLRAILAISACLMPAAMATAQAEVFYLRGPCRIYIDTDLAAKPVRDGDARLFAHDICAAYETAVPFLRLSN